MTAEAVGQSLDERRIATVEEHVRLENAHEFDACIAIFGSPKYEVVADGELYEGHDRVHDFLDENHTAFPDFHFEATRISATTDAVLVEGRYRGTHLGPWRGLPATGKKIDVAMCVIFEFEGESMTNEKIYFDLSSPLGQLGIADDFNTVRGKVTAAVTHPLVLVRAAVFSLTHRRVA